MTLFSSSPIFKASLLSGTIITALFIGGCNKNDTATDTADADTTNSAAVDSVATDADAADDTTTPVASSPSVVTPAEPQYSTLAQLSSDSFNNMVFVPLINSGSLTAEQKSCLQARDKNIGLAESQTFFESKFTKAELNELNEFYESPVGKKLIAYGNEQLRTMNGLEVKTPMADPSEQEIAEMQKFMQSPVGQKYMALNNAEGEGSMYEALGPTIKAELSRCNIEGVL